MNMNRFPFSGKIYEEKGNNMLRLSMQYFATKKGNEIPTIDCVMVTIKPNDSEDEIILTTANKVGVSTKTQTTDAVTLVVKGVLIAQKQEETTITGTTIVLTDNVFNPEVVVILQGGEITYKSGESGPISKYKPPVAGSKKKGKPFTLCVYSAIYDAAGLLTGYEKISYPNCQGVPVAFNSEDNVFRISEYTINSAPKTGESPYIMEYIGTEELPTVA